MKRLIQKFGPFIKYSVVGVLGTFIDLASLYLFVEFVHLPVLVGATLSFLLAVVNNFALNKLWTFQNKSSNYRKLFLKFLTVSVIGLLLTLVCMHILVTVIGIWYLLAKAITSGVVLVWNFLGNKLWTFKLTEKKIDEPREFLFDLSIIIPAFDEEKRIEKTLLEIAKFAHEKNLNAEIIVVNDGSRDNTVRVVEKLKSHIKDLALINLQRNHGKGFGVAEGVRRSRGRRILFTDADNSTPIHEYEKLKRRMNEENAQMAIGSRYLHDSEVHIAQPMYRIALGRAANFIISLFLIDGVRDTQCGFKLFDHHAAREIFSFQKIQRFAFDIELLVVAESLGYKYIEVPISWYNSTESRVRPIRDALQTLADLVFIKLNLWGGRYSRDD